jgi:hypothetical protein
MHSSSINMIFIVFTALFVNMAFTTRYGVPDNRVHQFAGYIADPSRTIPNTCTPAGRVLYYSCGGSLVNIPGFPSRRIFLTSRHCAQRDVQTDKFYVHFGDADLRDRDPACGKVIGVKNNTATVVYSASNAWYPPISKNDVGDKIGGVVLTGHDYAILLLDQTVSTSQVDAEAIIFDSSSMSNANLAASLPIVGTAGYGIVGYGQSTSDYTLGNPVSFSGDRDKEYVEQKVNSISNEDILARSNAALKEGATCSGDSGSAAILPAKLNGFYYIFGSLTSGDLYCRALSHYTRVGTAAFNTWLQSIKVDVIAKAL